MTDAAGINASGDDWALSDPTGVLGLNTLPNGTVFRCVFDIQGSVAASPLTFSTMLNQSTITRTNTTTSNTVLSNATLRGGVVVYMVVSGTSLITYNSIEAATNGAGSGQYFFRAITAAAGQYLFDCALVRYGQTEINVNS